ncbi:lymphocyte antigen 6F-like [Arvicanthis niloticus]|uniref:lymphocyte antigen 6F-like n=1 Tax=Arvicanthis niloticus TaxID=61156 RepID=UPI00402B6C33
MNSSHTTKSCVFILLVALLCAERAQGLICYRCRRVLLEASCPLVTCSKLDAFCVTKKIDSVFSVHRKTKKESFCFPSCPPTFERISLFLNVTNSCCKEDRCNAEYHTDDSTWTMTEVPLFSLGSVLLQTLLRWSFQ